MSTPKDRCIICRVASPPLIFSLSLSKYWCESEGRGHEGRKRELRESEKVTVNVFWKHILKKKTTRKTSLDKNHGSLNFLCCWTAFYHLRRLKVSHNSIWISQVNFELFFGHSFIITYDYVFRLLQWPLGLGNMETRRKRPPGLVLFLHDCMFEVENFTI